MLSVVSLPYNLQLLDGDALDAQVDWAWNSVVCMRSAADLLWGLGKTWAFCQWTKHQTDSWCKTVKTQLPLSFQVQSLVLCTYLCIIINSKY